MTETAGAEGEGQPGEAEGERTTGGPRLDRSSEEASIRSAGRRETAAVPDHPV